jgi:hypothetical protein
MSAKTEYEMLIQDENFLEIYPGFTGDWKKDKKMFTELYIQNIEVIGYEEE